MKTLFAKFMAKYIAIKQNPSSSNSIESQKIFLQEIIHKAQNTTFGKDHKFSDIKNYREYKNNVPVRNYEEFLPYIEKIRQGEKDILWPEIPKYWAKTSGTTSGSKYIPITSESLSYHISAARNALLHYINETKKTDFIKGHMLFLSGSPILSKNNDILEGRLSGIVNHHVPFFVKNRYLPSFETNSIEDWYEKLNKIVEETLKVDLTLISGIPPWIQMFCDFVLKKTGAQNIKEVFPNLNLIVFGGVNFEPYRKKLIATIGEPIDFIETYPASEGFIAFQCSQNSTDLLLQTDNGMFFEFIPVDEFFSKNPTRISLEEVKIGVNYALLITSNAGLWAYSIGDTIKFTNTNPYKIVVTGRIKHFTSAFGEHVIGEEVDAAMAYALSQNTETEIEDFTVAPYVSYAVEDKSFHEWFIEFKTQPTDIKKFAKDIEEKLIELNPYYKDLIKDKVLQNLQITHLPKKSFELYMQKRGMLGGQNKIVHLSNDRKMAEEILNLSS